MTVDTGTDFLLPLPDRPDYFINPYGQVYSKKSGELRPLKIRQTSHGKFFVHIYETQGRRQTLGIRKLLADTFGVRFEDWMKDLLRESMKS